MDEYLEITLTEYGFTFSSNPIYLNLQWTTIVVIVAIVTGYKVYKAYKHKKELEILNEIAVDEYFSA